MSRMQFAAIAFDALGKSNVVGAAMPSQYSSLGSISDAKSRYKARHHPYWELRRSSKLFWRCWPKLLKPGLRSEHSWKRNDRPSAVNQFLGVVRFYFNGLGTLGSVLSFYRDANPYSLLTHYLCSNNLSDLLAKFINECYPMPRKSRYFIISEVI